MYRTLKVEKTLTVLISAIFILAISTCGSADAAKRFVTIATGDSGGTFFALGGAMAELIGQVDGVICNTQSTKGSEENIFLINDAKADVAFTNSSLAFYGFNGTEMFKDKKTTNIRSMGELYPMHFHLIVGKASGIKSISDMAGKKIAVAPPGSGTEANVRQFISAWNMDYDKFKPSFISFSNAVDQLKNRAIDGAFVGAGIPTSAIMDLMSTGGFELVSMEKDKVESLKERYPFFSYGTIPTDTYANQPKDVGAILVNTSLICNAELPDDLVYEMSKAIYENTERLANTHSVGKNISAEKAPIGLAIELHPGTRRYLEEKGVELK